VDGQRCECRTFEVAYYLPFLMFCMLVVKFSLMILRVYGSPEDFYAVLVGE
jgi:hypothetical protein